MLQLSKPQELELYNIGNNMPLDAGDLTAHEYGQDLIDMGLALRYEGKYCLTEAGKAELKERKIDAAKRLANRSVLFGTGGGEM